MDIPKWPKGLPYPISWLRAIALFKGSDLIVAVGLPGAESLDEVIGLLIFSWLCQLPLFTAYHYLATKVAQWVETWRPEFQHPHQKGAWQHWREGLKAILVMFVATAIVAIISSVLLPRPLLQQFMRSPLNLPVMVTVSAYLYYWEISRRFKSLVVFCWPLIDTYLKTQLLLYIPVISCLPVALVGLLAAALVSKLNLPGALLGLGIFLAAIMWLFTAAAAFAAIHYYGAHWANWVADWWPQSFPGHKHLQQRKAQRHNASVSKSFIYHETSWKLAAHDLTVLIYANVLSSIASIPIYIAIFNELSSEASQGKPTETSEALSAALYLVWTAIAMLLWHFWGRKHAAKIMAASAAKAKAKAKKGKAKTIKKSKKTQPPADPIEIELNQMSGDFGMTPMRPVRKTPDPEKTEWYVFRGGQSEGPYTREQLWLAQRITARTNVRREGETDWTRAGEIPELTDFLNTKP